MCEWESCKPSRCFLFLSAGDLILFPKYFGKYEATHIRSVVPGGEGGVMHGEASGRENTDGYHRGREPEACSAPGEAEV